MISANRRIGVIIPEITDSLDFALLEGMFSQARRFGYDLLLFTGIYNTHAAQGYNEYRSALDNIYTLPKMADLDALVFAGDRFVSEDIIRFCDKQVRNLPIPKVMVHHPTDGYINIKPEQEEFMYRMTRHMIDVHHCKKIMCLAGVEGEIATMERLAGFRRAMAEAGIAYTDADIVYGHFWIDIPKQLGRDIAEGKIVHPDAVVCMNDFMASALIESLKENGLSVPNDIAVTGYDGNRVSIYTDPQITTIIGRDTQLGAAAIAKIHEILSGEQTEIPADIQRLSIRGSCGCKWDVSNNPIPDTTFLKFSQNLLNQYYHRKEFITSDFMTTVTTAEFLEQLISRIREYKNMIYHAENVDICLCEDWKADFADTSRYRKAGYSDYMLSILSEDDVNRRSVGRMFPVKELLPFLMNAHEPMITVFTSLFCKNQILGYVATSFREVRDISIDEFYVNWCDSVANGFRNVQEKMYRDYVQRELAMHTFHDPQTGLLNKKGLLDQARSFVTENGTYCMLLIAYAEGQENAAESGFSPHQLVANAIRFTSEHRDLYARIGERMFCILLRLENGESSDFAADERVLRVEKNIRYMQGNVRGLFRAELVGDGTVLEGCDLMYLEEMLLKRMQILQERVSGGVLTGNSLKEQLYSLRHQIRLSPERDWSIRTIARQIGISESYLQHLYKAEFSTSCFDDIIAARVEKAKQLLTTTDLRISEIADRCGYQSCRHFSRQFTQYTGAAPSAFREQNI